MEFDELGGAVVFYEAEGVDAETVLLVVLDVDRGIEKGNLPCAGSFVGCRSLPLPRIRCAWCWAGS